MRTSMQKFIVFTDTHVGEFKDEKFGPASFEAGVRHALLRHPDAEFLVHLGDLTQNGFESEYEQVRPVLDAIDIDVRLIPGNHDDRANMKTSLPEFVHADPAAMGFVQSASRVGSNLILALDTHSDGSIPDSPHSGHLCPARLNWVREQVVGVDAARIIVLMHHPPFRVGMKILDACGLANGGELIEILDLSEVPVHIVCGHVHRTISGMIGRHGFSVCRGSSQTFGLVDAEARVHQWAEPNDTADSHAYNVVFLYDESVVMHTQLYAA